MYLLFIWHGTKWFCGQLPLANGQGSLEGVGPKNRDFWALKWQLAKRMPFGPKEVEFRAITMACMVWGGVRGSKVTLRPVVSTLSKDDLFTIVLGIRSILVRILVRIRMRILILGSVPLTNRYWCGSGMHKNIPYESGSETLVKSHKAVTKYKQSRFFLVFLLDDGGSAAGSRSILVTNGSGCGSRRPKNIRILRIRIPNTVLQSLSLHVSLILSCVLSSPCCRKLTIGSIHLEHPLVLVVGGLVALEHEDEARQLLVVHGLDLSQRQSDQEP